MTIPPVYSQIFPCLYDQANPVGHMGRGAHYSVCRSIQWRDIDGDFRDSGRFHDFAVIWDEDHDTRIIAMLEHLHMTGLLWPVLFAGERKGVLTLLLAGDVDPSKENFDWYETVRDIAAHATETDSWTVEFGAFYKDPANREGKTDPAGLISDSDDRVIAYLQSIDLLWHLGCTSSS